MRGCSGYVCFRSVPCLAFFFSLTPPAAAGSRAFRRMRFLQAPVAPVAPVAPPPSVAPVTPPVVPPVAPPTEVCLLWRFVVDGCCGSWRKLCGEVKQGRSDAPTCVRYMWLGLSGSRSFGTTLQALSASLLESKARA